MDIEKSLYMADFLKMREDLGKIKLYPVTNTLFINLYDEFKPKQQSEEVEEVIEEIQDKTIQIGAVKGQHTFFDDEAAAASVSASAVAAEVEEEEKGEEIKVTKVSDETSKGGDPTMKTITFDPTYVAS